MKDKELRKLIGSRAKQRRLELNLTQPYVAEKMGVTASTILRYENGSIDNTKRWCWKVFRKHFMYLLNGSEGKPMNTKPILRIRKNYRFVMQWAIFSNSYLSTLVKGRCFSKDLLLLMLKQYNLFLESFQFACKNYKGNTNEADIAK